MKKFSFSELIAIISFFVICWVLLSWLDIVAHNKSDFIYQSWNFFTLFF